jgi:hypothetical protein
MNIKELIEELRKLPEGGKIDLERSEFETIFHDSEPVRRAQGIAALNGCTFKLEPNSGIGTFTRRVK